MTASASPLKAQYTGRGGKAEVRFRPSVSPLPSRASSVSCESPPPGSGTPQCRPWLAGSALPGRARAGSVKAQHRGPGSHVPSTQGLTSSLPRLPASMMNLVTRKCTLASGAGRPTEPRAASPLPQLSWPMASMGFRPRGPRTPAGRTSVPSTRRPAPGLLAAGAAALARRAAPPVPPRPARPTRPPPPALPEPPPPEGARGGAQKAVLEERAGAARA